MGEDSEQENHLKPYENNSLIFYVLSSTFRKVKNESAPEQEAARKTGRRQMLPPSISVL